MMPDPSAVLVDLRRVGVLLRRHVAGFFEQGQIHERRRVALGAGIAVPVPGAPEVATLFDDAHVGVTGLDQCCAGHETGEAATDECELDLVGERLALDTVGVGIVRVAGEGAGHLEVLVVAVGTEALVSLRAVSGVDGVPVDLS